MAVNEEAAHQMALAAQAQAAQAHAQAPQQPGPGLTRRPTLAPLTHGTITSPTMGRRGSGGEGPMALIAQREGSLTVAGRTGSTTIREKLGLVGRLGPATDAGLVQRTGSVTATESVPMYMEKLTGRLMSALDMTGDLDEEVFQEIQFMQMLDHPHLIRLHEIIQVSPGSTSGECSVRLVGRLHTFWQPGGWVNAAGCPCRHLFRHFTGCKAVVSSLSWEAGGSHCMLQ